VNAEEMKRRTRTFALRVIKLVESLPNTPTARVIGNQLLRCGTSVGANYRAASRARSNADFIAKMGIVEEEADESAYWIEMLIDTNLVKATLVTELLDESNQIVAIVVSSINTARNRKR
jgi:four helix bundle protein